MKSTNIGSRLLMAASFVDNGNVVCDVGCDHGKLSYYLIKEGKAKHIIATDINKQPLQKAIDLFKDNDLSQTADFYLTDGLQNVENTRNITHIVIAGLGGETMSNVLQAATFINSTKPKLVLIPAQSGNKIRRYLFENGYSILEEKTVMENKKFYTCINAIYTGEVIQPSVYDCFIGKSFTNNDASALGYFSMILGQLEKVKKGLDKYSENEQNEIEQAIEKIKQLINSIKEKAE